MFLFLFPDKRQLFKDNLFSVFLFPGKRQLGVSQIAQLVKNPPAMQKTPAFDSWVGKIGWSRGRVFTPVFLGFPGDATGKESACNAGDLGLIPGLGRLKGKGYPLQYSGLENSMDYSPWGYKELDMTE